MKSWILLALALLLAAIGGIAHHWHRQDSAWTTDSPEARAAFVEGMEARIRVEVGADRHLRRALELDPDFVAPRLFLIDNPSPQQRAELIRWLQDVDRDKLSPRERFLADYRLALLRGAAEEATRMLGAYLQRFPRDPHALNQAALEALTRDDVQGAETYYRRLLEVEPNWVNAQNWLGYLAMGKGNFQEAEDHFKTYQYISPNQANPHDSMGELLVVTGRYEEASREFEKAVALQPDFRFPYAHLILVALLEGDLDAAQRSRRRLAEAVAAAGGDGDGRCFYPILWGLADGDWAEALEATTGCRLEPAMQALAHRGALLSGRLEVAEDVERDLDERQGRVTPLISSDTRLGTLAFVRGGRALFQGDEFAAMAQLELADRLLTYRPAENALLKLIAKGDLADALEKRGGPGDDERAAALRRQVLEVNPRFARIRQYVTLLPPPAPSPDAPPEAP